MDLQRLLLIVRARWKLGVWVLGLTVLTALAVSLVLPRQYVASTAVVLDVKSPDPVAGMVLPGLMQPSYLATQMDIIKSERVAARAAQLLGLQNDVALRGEWMAATGGKVDFAAWIGQQLRGALSVNPVRDSTVLNIDFVAKSPEFAAQAANAFARAYIDTSIQLRAAPAQQYAGWFDDQVRMQREQLEKAQLALSAFQQKTGIVASDERLDFETARLNDLSSLLTQVESQKMEADSKARTAQSANLPEVLQNPLVVQLRGEVARLESELRQQVARTGVNHPQVRQLQAQLSELKGSLSAEIARVRASLGASGKAGLYRAEDLQAAIAQQKNKILELKKERDEISVLQLEVANAQKAYDAVSARAAQSRLESQMVQTNVSVLSRAESPLIPASPKILLNLVVATVVGAVLALVAMLVRETLDRRVRLDGELVEICGVQQIGSLQRVRQATETPAKRLSPPGAPQLGENSHG
ncbi:chain length determinant protein EpsF [Crenobacter caeni]|uniref:Chain length determinant protein EpsF n=1 Tax=Crenobacter caeni TaxID=2705474 RepID=A0A6B2KSB3_9NEIS|nr:chain length determinant protein EpsF [Crenobacter caeni]NDV13132.1 chain length determinant protein EpsF [Crenobacter caeni]